LSWVLPLNAASRAGENQVNQSGEALRAAGLPMIHFHDLRHTGNQLAANAGANLRELMDRMGHSTTRAAMAYLHGSDQRQQAIADEPSRQAAAALGEPNPGRSGTQRARRRGRAS
jgi:integrase